MWNAVVVDRDYGSVSLEKQQLLVENYAKKGMNLRLEHFKTDDEIVAGCADADALLCTGTPPITAKVLKGLPRLKVVQRFGIGVNSVDLEAATEAGVLAMFMPGFCIEELAVHATALILNLMRNVSYYDRGIRSGEWRKAKGPMPPNPEDLTLGLFGFGGSARKLWKIFKDGFGTKVLAYDPYISPDKAPEGVEMVSFEELLAQSDIVSLHAPLTPETRHIFNKEAFEKMKKNAMIVNISRGELIDQKALEEALEQGEIQFAGLDVYEQEPLPADSPLIQRDDVILTCHSAFYGVNSQKNQLSLALELVDGVLNHKKVSGRYIANKGVVSKIEDLIIE